MVSGDLSWHERFRGMSAPSRPITVSIHAIGGQGGGVLAEWIVAVARQSGWLAQSTSVPGVAQRTGATVYYIEIFPESEAAGQEPLFALMPTPGDVDLVIAAELMEAGRAINRGLVTPERTTLVMSTSRVYSVAEKSGLGDGRLSDAPVLAAAKNAARCLIAADMESAAQHAGSVISAPLLGSVAGCGSLPFTREAYETVIGSAGIATKTNLAGFAAGFALASEQTFNSGGEAAVSLAQPREIDKIVAEGVRRLTDYQDHSYANLYRARLARFERFERADSLLTGELARYLALWMSYEDTIRVADLKTRSARFARVRNEVSAEAGQIVHIVEYLHPRLEEVCDTLPKALGAWILRTTWLRNRLAPLFSRGRRITTSKLGGFLLLYSLARLRRWRRASLRYATENSKIEDWLGKLADVASQNYDLAVEIARCQRLIKGYGDTYDRGWRNFGLLMAQVERVDAATLARLRMAALADDEGRTLAAAIAGIGQV
jgi:indolepyruvate ferredoxin oxidoreductase, beta subunit